MNGSITMSRLSFARSSMQQQQRQSRGGQHQQGEEMNIFCSSDLVSQDFVMDKLKDVRQNRSIVKLQVEDLIMDIRYCSSLLPQVKALSLRSDRTWKRIEFIDTVCSTEFARWRAMKEKLMDEYESLGIDDTSSYTRAVCFHATVEVNQGAIKTTVIKLLKGFQQDKDVTDVSYGGALFGYEQAQIPGAFSDLFDENRILKENLVVNVKCGWADLAEDFDGGSWRSTLQSTLNHLEGKVQEHEELPASSDSSSHGHRMQRRQNLSQSIHEGTPQRGSAVLRGSLLPGVGSSLSRFKTAEGNFRRQSEHRNARSVSPTRNPARRCNSWAPTEVRRASQRSKGYVVSSKQKQQPQQQRTSLSPRRAPRRHKSMDPNSSPTMVRRTTSEGRRKSVVSPKRQSHRSSLSPRRTPRRHKSMDPNADASPARRASSRDRRKSVVANPPKRPSSLLDDLSLRVGIRRCNTDESPVGLTRNGEKSNSSPSLLDTLSSSLAPRRCNTDGSLVRRTTSEGRRNSESRKRQPSLMDDSSSGFSSDRSRTDESPAKGLTRSGRKVNSSPSLLDTLSSSLARNTDVPSVRRTTSEGRRNSENRKRPSVLDDLSSRLSVGLYRSNADDTDDDDDDDDDSSKESEKNLESPKVQQQSLLDDFSTRLGLDDLSVRLGLRRSNTVDYESPAAGNRKGRTLPDDVPSPVPMRRCTTGSSTKSRGKQHRKRTSVSPVRRSQSNGSRRSPVRSKSVDPNGGLDNQKTVKVIPTAA